MLTLLAITACSPYRDMPDRWTEAYALCEPPQPFARPADTAAPLPEACVERLAQDFGIARSYETPEIRDWLIEATYNLLARDLGRVSELEITEYTREPFITRTREQAEHLGTDDLRATLYSFTAFEIELIEESERDFEGFYYYAEGKAVWLNIAYLVEGQPELPRATDWAVTLTHEASHAVVPPHKRCEHIPDWGCDADWGGAYGTTLAMAEQMLRTCDWENDWYNCSLLDEELETKRWRVEAD